jgi:hypothetical protein
VSRFDWPFLFASIRSHPFPSLVAQSEKPRALAGVQITDMDAKRAKTVEGILLIIVCLLAIPIILSVVMPSFRRARGSSSNSCINNLRQIDGAVATWALEERKTTNDTPAWADLVGTDRYIRDMPACSAGGTYNLGPAGTKPTCTVKGHTI